MIVEHFYFGMIEADEKDVQGLMFHILLDGKWSYIHNTFKVCHVMQIQTLNNFRGKTCVWHFLHDVKKLQVQVTS